MHRRAPRRLRPLFMAAACLCLIGTSFAADLREEDSVRAAFVFNLTRYVEWPGSISTLRICFLGDSGTGAVLKAVLQGKISEQRTVEVSLDGEQPPERCQVFYVDFQSPERTRAAIQRARGHAVLTLGVAETFASNGGMIGLVTRKDRIQLQVNREAIQASGLKISSRILALATIVDRTGSGQ